MTTEPCPCGLDTYDACCAPFHRGDAAVPTAERLMRARYSAYARGEVDFLLESILEESREDHDRAVIEQWSAESEWLGLEVLATEAGGESDDAGTVEFVARYRNPKGERISHHELAEFTRVDDRWYFKDGNPVEGKTVVRDAPKVGRNDPCPCGSGKKYKKCCAVVAG